MVQTASTRALHGVVFDLDGTLLDTAPGLTEALNRVLREVGRAPLAVAQVKPMIGDGVDRLIQRAAEATGGPLPPDDHVRTVLRYRALMLEAPAPAAYPGAREALERLRLADVRLVVCTNKPSAAARDVLRDSGLDDLLNGVVGADAAPLKPDPTMVREALLTIEVSPSHAVLVGDSEVDVATARAAGIAVVLLGHGYVRGPLIEAGADATTNGFATLLPTLESIGFRIGA
ncbi:MAG: HAD-IA family hydrolase [Gemmatimonas sp.]